MRRWAFVVAFLYVLALVIVLVPLLMVAFPGKTDFDLRHWELPWQVWAILTVMGMAQALLLLVPVKVERRRPITRRSLIPPAIASALMTALLILGASLSLSEALFDGSSSDLLYQVPLGIALASWLLWSIVFFRWGRSMEPRDWVTRTSRLLFRGSILELLIAVPSHVVARSRDWCCAGVMTAFGLMCGTAVMLFSFGPAVLILFLQRWKKIHPPEQSAAGPPSS